jgi:hypothetical protein
MIENYALELSTDDKIRILIRVNYGFYVIERILLRCKNEELNAKIREEVF